MPILKFIRNILVKPNKFFKIDGSATKNISFSQIGEENTDFDIEVADIQGVGRIEIVAKSGSHTATYEIEIQIRNPNPKTTEVLEKVINPGQTWTSDYTPVGISGTNTGVLEVSNIPPINLEYRLKYLISYPHGCIEQTTSAVFPQLYVSELIELDAVEKKKSKKT